MNVTNVRVDKYFPKKAKGVCAEMTIILDGSFAVHRVTVLNGDKGLYVGFPSMGDVVIRNGKKRYCDIAHPLNNFLSEEIKSQVLLAYERYRLGLTE